MARLESVSSGGFFPTPSHLIPLIAERLSVGSGSIALADPCAGDGAAILALSEALGDGGTLFTCEMEAQRYSVLHSRLAAKSWHGGQNALHGDAFRLEMKNVIGLLFLNPPYDLDPVHGRLEQRFLERFTGCLTDHGILVFIVPYYALAASMDLLAREYDDLECFRFPDEDFAAFKQVVLFAKKVDTRLSSDRAIMARVQAWATDVKGMPLLGASGDSYEIPGSHPYAGSWALQKLDLKGLVRKARPWRESRAKAAGALTYVPHTLPETPVEDLLFRTFPIATACRPAHIAAGIASGLFNGREVSSTTRGMPNLLVKGVFDRDYVTIQENRNKDGEVTSVTQVQQPKLVTTVLDLDTKRYSTLKPMGSPKGKGIEDLSIEGLLEHYGPSLMNVMNLQCPVGYDPKRDSDRLPLAPVVRPLYTAQDHAAKALYGLLGGPECSHQNRQGKAAILLGEIGSGKSATVLAVGKTIAKRMLVLCPPHLLTSWTDEIRALVPTAEVRVLETLTDVDALESVPSNQFLVAVLSRETAKLGHGWESVAGPGCPKCGAVLPSGDLAKKRLCCTSTPLTLRDDLARAAFTLALRFAPCEPQNGNVHALLEGRHMQSYLARLATDDKAEWPGFDAKWVLSTLSHVTQRLVKSYDERLALLLGKLLLADYQPERIASLARTFTSDKLSYHYQSLAHALTCLLPFGSDLQNEVRAITYVGRGYYGSSFETDAKALEGIGLSRTSLGHIKLDPGGGVSIDDEQVGSLALAKSILSKLAVVGHFSRPEKECGEPLFQAIAEPRRYPLARYISRRHPDLFDFLVLDEGHEYSSDTSAQGFAAHRLTALGIPTILMTGSIMNGYAASLFTNMWALSREFRAEFKRDERQRYVDRYGYRKRILTDKDRETGEIVSFGAVTDRVERHERTAGDAPGLLPLFLFRHLLAFSVTLHKADLALDLPPCRHIKKTIEPSPKLLASYKKLQTDLVARIRKDQFSEFSGKLFGALAELPSYLDRATSDTGNQDDGSYSIHYPESVGGALVSKGETFTAKTILPKEQWMLDTIAAELAEGRNVMVFSWHVSLLPRLARLIEAAIGEKVPVLYADKVPTAKRQAWIDKNIIQKGIRVMVLNPVCVATGLNNLVHFSTEIHYENPACNPTIYRQAIGRVDRIGQKRETRIYTPIYNHTLQIQLHELLLRKVAVATATDGLDNESALLAAGASEDAQLTGLSIGRQLWALLNEN